MKKVTIKEIRIFLKTLEENRYRKLVNADARRIAWFVNNSMSENYDDMPESMRKKWVKAEYKKERYMAKKFLEGKKQNESVEIQVRQLVRETIKDLMEGNRIQFIIPYKDRKKVAQVLQKTKLKMGKDYDFGVGKGATFLLDIDSSYRNKFVELAIKHNIGVRS